MRCGVRTWSAHESCQRFMRPIPSQHSLFPSGNGPTERPTVQTRAFSITEPLTWRLVHYAEGQRPNASHLVSAAKRVGDQRLFPLVVKLVNIELAEEARDREYREQWQAKGKKPEPIRHMLGYGPIHRQALTPFTGGQVRDYLISLLDDPGFGVEAAFELRRFGTERELDKPGQFLGTRSKYDRLREARTNRAKA